MKEIIGADSIRETPDKHLPALKDGDTILLPEAVLPLPLGGTSLNPGLDGEDEWADLAKTILVPRWAVECIREDLVLGQELQEREGMKERLETILRTPGELDKWKRIVGFGITAVRHLDLDAAEKWGGGLLELIELDTKNSTNHSKHYPFSGRFAYHVSVDYWDSWAQEGWRIVDASRGGKLSEADRERATRLVAEGQAYWQDYPIPNKTFGRIWVGSQRWKNSDVGQMCHCLKELLLPPTERKLPLEVIWLTFGGNMAYYHAMAQMARSMMRDRVRYNVIIAQAEMHAIRSEAQLAEARAQEQEAKAGMYKAQGRADAEAEARGRAEAKRQEAELAYQQEAMARVRAEAERDTLRELTNEDIAQMLDCVAGVPRMVAEAQDAREAPEETALEIMRFIDAELSPEARMLWMAWKENNCSLNAAAKKCKMPETTARRKFKNEIVSFYKKHNWTLPKESGWGKRKKVRMSDSHLDEALYQGRGIMDTPIR